LKTILGCWAAITIAVVACGAACGGASETDLLTGDGGASSSSGSLPSSSSSSGGASSSSSSSSGAADSGSRCTVGNATSCPPGEYCVGACGQTGTCTPMPSALPTTYQPVCGCDNVLYWNSQIAAHAGMGFWTEAGSCKPIACSAENACPNDLYCGMRRNTCGTASGLCWRVPESCPDPGTPNTGPPALECGGNSCRSLCEAIKQEKPFVTVNLGQCP
jgi:hypothetical protein